ncbi:peptidoglycan DD-metalloendopeptidase family protein [Paraburkholderia aromaticivorans]|uniref:Peptidase M23 n=1 Tax=Paraburkholderia aromaticivorans TaxID=2026199 RepID=A0A248VP09_9BURK|nr:peptidoglycan DD-metalloendopeptidase family protein [Paraburkholderia aromaticivorans]ASW00778.1 peptidase M23 [Paraburkholderia aromaticivorans]
MKPSLSRCVRWGFATLCALSLAGSLAGCAPFRSGTVPRGSAHVAGTSPSLALPAAESAPAVPAGFYRVNPGDTQTGVARAFGREPAAIGQWNGLLPDDGLQIGQVLRVAPPVAEDGLPPSTTSSDSRAQARALFADGSNRPPPAAARLGWPAGGPVIERFVAGSTKGIVVGGHAGEPVRAASGGRVVYSGGRIAAYGKLIIIKHDRRLLTAYGNNRALLVKEGAAVKAGAPIAEMGADDKGQASLRFEVRVDGRPVDPLAYLPNRP